MLQPGHNDFSRKAAELISRAKISRERLLDVGRVQRDLERVLYSQWPESRLMMVGSMVTGLAVTGSDVDFSLMLPQNGISSESLATDTEQALGPYPLLFSELHITHPWVTVPVVKFKHVPTHFSVDLSFNNYNSERVTEFFDYILHLDERIYSLSFILKRWATLCGVTRKRVFPKYGIILMIIFYLQQLKMLPSVASMQRNARPVIIDGWDHGFDKIDYDAGNGMPLNLLLGGFFEYYHNFDYEKYAMCPYLGLAVERDRLEYVSKVPESRKVKEGAARALPPARLFLQDVFLHDDNVAWASSHFTDQFHRALHAYQQNNITFLENLFSC